jgi:TPR repeat protein
MLAIALILIASLTGSRCVCAQKSTATTQTPGCVLGGWRESKAGEQALNGAFAWTFSNSGDMLTIRRSDGFVSGTLMANSEHTAWVGSIAWGDGSVWKNVQLLFASCNLVKTNQGWWFSRGFDPNQAQQIAAQAVYPSTVAPQPAANGPLTVDQQLQAATSMADQDLYNFAGLGFNSLVPLANRGVPLAMYEAADRLHRGNGVTAKNEPLAQSLFQKLVPLFTVAMQRGNWLAEYLLGTMCEEGEGLPLEPQKAVGYYRDAAEHGDVPAIKAMAYGYRDGTNGIQQDYSVARYWMQRLAAYDPGNAQLLLQSLDQMQSNGPQQSADNSTGAPADSNTQPADGNQPQPDDSALGSFVNALGQATANSDPNAIQNAVSQQLANIQAAQARAAAAQAQQNQPLNGTKGGPNPDDCLGGAKNYVPGKGCLVAGR